MGAWVRKECVEVQHRVDVEQVGKEDLRMHAWTLGMLFIVRGGKEHTPI